MIEIISHYHDYVFSGSIADPNAYVTLAETGQRGQQQQQDEGSWIAVHHSSPVQNAKLAADRTLGKIGPGSGYKPYVEATMDDAQQMACLLHKRSYRLAATDVHCVYLTMEYDPQGIVENSGDAVGALDLRVQSTVDDFKEFIESRARETGAWRGEVHGGTKTRS